MSKTIYELKLHEEIELSEGRFVMRVPGGWLYTHYRLDRNAMTTTFVPFDKEGMEMTAKEMVRDARTNQTMECDKFVLDSPQPDIEESEVDND